MKVVPAVCAALIVCSACSTPDLPAPTPAPIDRAGAPLIVSPRDLARRAADPCGTLLTPSALRRLGFDSPGREETNLAGSSACVWRDGAVGRQIVAAVVVQGDLFVDTYRNPSMPIFRPLEIDGLPAADTRSSPDAPTCTTTVGVADGESLDITSLGAIGRGGRPASDPCEDGHQVAEAIVSALPPK